MSDTLEMIISIILGCNIIILYFTYAYSNYNATIRHEQESEIQQLKDELEIEKSRRRQCEKIIARGRICGK